MGIRKLRTSNLVICYFMNRQRIFMGDQLSLMDLGKLERIIYHLYFIYVHFFYPNLSPLLSIMIRYTSLFVHFYPKGKKKKWRDLTECSPLFFSISLWNLFTIFFTLNRRLETWKSRYKKSLCHTARLGGYSSWWYFSETQSCWNIDDESILFWSLV